jgi:sugar phosphate isomerase/epimerase
VLEVWGPLVEEAARLKVRIGIENCPMFFSRDEWPGGKNLAVSPAVWRRLFADLDSPWLGLNFDPSHLVWQWIDWERAIAEFGPRIIHVHAKDVIVNREGLYQHGGLALPTAYHEPRIPGRGEINWQRFLNALRAVSYTGPVCVEVEDRAYEGSLALREQSLAESAAHLRPFFR